MSEANDLNRLTQTIIGAAIQVHKSLGPGLLESAYRVCLAAELQCQGLRIEQEKAIPVVYRGVRLECGYRLDLLVEDIVIVEVKALEQVLPVHRAQLLSYLKLVGCPIGLLVNFHVASLTRGVHRIVNRFPDQTESFDSLSLRPLRSSATSALKEPSR